MDYGATEIVFEVPETVRINDLFNDKKCIRLNGGENNLRLEHQKNIIK